MPGAEKYAARGTTAPGTGWAGGGSLDLPVGRAPGGILAYEVLIGMTGATSDPFTVTGLDGRATTVATRWATPPGTTRCAAKKRLSSKAASASRSS